MKQETAVRVAQRGPNVARRAIPPIRRALIAFEAAGEREAEQKAQRGEREGGAHQHRHDDPDERVVSRRRVVDGQAGEDGGPTGKRPAGDD